MNKKRKIKLTVNKFNFKEAEDADDKYWANATVEHRLQELIALRRMFFGTTSSRLKRIVSKRSIHDEEN